MSSNDLAKQSNSQRLEIQAASKLKAVDATTGKVECPNMGLVIESPGWKTQELAKNLLTVDWSSQVLVDCASKLVGFVSGCLLTGQSKRFPNAGTLDMLSELTSGCLDATLQEMWFSMLVVLLGPQDRRITNNLMQHVCQGTGPSNVQRSYNNSMSACVKHSDY